MLLSTLSRLWQRRHRAAIALLAAVLTGAGFLASSVLAGSFAALPFVEAADLEVVGIDTPDRVAAGRNMTYTVTVRNAGRRPAAAAVLRAPVPRGTTLVSFRAPAGWTCTPRGCTSTSALAPAASDTFTYVVNVTARAGSRITNAARVGSATPDRATANNTETDFALVAGTIADVFITKTDSPDPVTAGNNLTYTMTVGNAAEPTSDTITLSDPIPSNTTFVSFTNPAAWTCMTPAAGGTGTVTCTLPPPLAGGAPQVFTLVVNVNPSTPDGSSLTNVASVLPVDVTDNNTDTEQTSVLGATAVTLRFLRAAPSRRGVLLRWRTASELGTIGFDVYRQVKGVSTRLNRTLVPAKGAGLYSFLDRRAPRGTALRYWIREIAADGTRQWHGPVLARRN